MNRYRIGIVGGGITGLSAAHELARAGCEVVVFERDDRLGGKIRTSRFAGRSLDEGADAFLARVPEGIELCGRLGLADELVAPATGRAFIAYDDGLQAIPADTVLGVPLNPSPRRGRPDPAPLGADESIGAVIRRQLGDDVHEQFVDPLVGSINAGDTDRLSIDACTPQLAAAARRGPDIVAELRATASPLRSGPVFYGPSQGMGSVIDALAAELADCVRPGVGVAAIEPDRAGWLVHDTRGGSDHFEGLILATPSPDAVGLLRPLWPDAADHLAIDLVSVAFVSIAIAREAIGSLPDGSGFLVPRPRRTLLTACSISSNKWHHLQRPDDVVLRASVGRDGDQRFGELDDSELTAGLLDELAAILDIAGQPEAVRISRWPNAFPQYRPGHLERVDEAERALADVAPGIVLAGSSYRGLGVPACIRQGWEAAGRVVATMPG